MPPLAAAAPCRRAPRWVAGLVALAAFASGAGAAPPQMLNTAAPHFALVRWDAPVPTEAAQPEEFRAYNDAVLAAAKLDPLELLAAGSRDVTYRDLVHREVGRDYQYKLFALEGRLRKLRRVEPTKPLKDAGVADLYECWVTPSFSSELVCVLATRLPAGLEPSLLYPEPIPVRFGGYYFKLFQYKAADPDKPGQDRTYRAPLFVTSALDLPPAPPPAAGPDDRWVSGFLPGVLGIMAVVGVVGLGLTAWFRRGDRAVRRTLEGRRRQNPFGAEGTGADLS